MRTLLVALAFLSIGPVADALCKPEKMLHVVTTTEAPGLPDDHFARKPRTLYRYQNGYGRVEEAPDPGSNLHLLIVVAEPDMWMANRYDSTGQHAVDPGPTYNFRAPLTPDIRSEYWNNLEFGCEAQFMQAVGATPENVQGTELKKYVHSAEDVTVVLFVRNDGKPAFADVSTGDLAFRVRYQVYEFLEPRMELFEMPEGVTFTESN